MMCSCCVSPCAPRQVGQRPVVEWSKTFTLHTHEDLKGIGNEFWRRVRIKILGGSRGNPGRDGCARSPATMMMTDKARGAN